jgi:predicted RNA-binding Zn ribbon-like protein
MEKTGRVQNRIRNNDWRDGFLFVGNHLVLDFLNTRPMKDGELVELLPDFTALVRWFGAAGLVSSGEAKAVVKKWGRSARARKATTEAREFREQMRKEIQRWERGGAVSGPVIEEINRLGTAHPMRIRLKAGENGTVIEEWFERNSPEDFFAPLAHSAAKLLATVEHGRIHKCANNNCVLHFLDTSKKGTRRWCSMRLCGNRLKVAAYAARKRNS